MDRLNLFNQYRPLLFSIAYRMLGSVSDAEDMVQDTFLHWQQAPDAALQSPKAYLSKIITHRCVDHLRSARIQREKYVGLWLPEPFVTKVVDDPANTLALADSLSFAFLIVLESLSPTERAIFLLREVFDYDYGEISDLVGKSETNCPSGSPVAYGGRPSFSTGLTARLCGDRVSVLQSEFHTSVLNT